MNTNEILWRQKLILEAVKGDLVEGSIVSELDLKLAEPAPPEHICSMEQVQDEWEEIEQYYDEISGTLSPPELIRAGRAQEIRRCESRFREHCHHQN